MYFVGEVRKGAGVIFIMLLQYVWSVFLFTFTYVYVSVWMCACEHRCLWISRTWSYGAVVSHHPTRALGPKLRSGAGAVIALKVAGHLSNSKMIIL